MVSSVILMYPLLLSENNCVSSTVAIAGIIQPFAIQQSSDMSLSRGGGKFSSSNLKLYISEASSYIRALLRALLNYILLQERL